MPNTPEQEQEIETWMKSQGFKWHADVLKSYWEKGDFRQCDYIRVERNAATFFYRAMKAAEKNGVAWAVGVLDDLHNKSSDNTADKLYKGAKNTIRDRFQAETGSDPAPSYPVNARLATNTTNKEKSSD